MHKQLLLSSSQWLSDSYLFSKHKNYWSNCGGTLWQKIYFIDIWHLTFDTWHVNIWIFEHLIIWIFEHLTIWTFEHLNIWTFEHLNNWTFKHCNVLGLIKIALIAPSAMYFSSIAYLVRMAILPLKPESFYLETQLISDSW